MRPRLTDQRGLLQSELAPLIPAHDKYSLTMNNLRELSVTLSSYAIDMLLKFASSEYLPAKQKTSQC